MEFASKMKEDAINSRRARMMNFAENDVQSAITIAKNYERQGTAAKIPIDIDMNMLKNYIEGFGYNVTEQSGRYLHIAWEKPKA